MVDVEGGKGQCPCCGFCGGGNESLGFQGESVILLLLHGQVGSQEFIYDVVIAIWCLLLFKTCASICHRPFWQGSHKRAQYFKRHGDYAGYYFLSKI
jgi:hypothetical protein